MNGSSQGGAPNRTQRRDAYSKTRPTTETEDKPVLTDGGDTFGERVDEIHAECLDDVVDVVPEEALVYARCCAAAEIAVNDHDLDVDPVLGVMTAALREAAEQGGIRFEDVLASARDVHTEGSE